MLPEISQAVRHKFPSSWSSDLDHMVLLSTYVCLDSGVSQLPSGVASVGRLTIDNMASNCRYHIGDGHAGIHDPLLLCGLFDKALHANQAKWRKYVRNFPGH